MDKKVENYIYGKYNESKNEINIEYIDLYKGFEDKYLREMFSTIHYLMLSNFKLMNSRLPTRDYTNHFWADSSRQLIFAIDLLKGLERVLKNTEFEIEIETYYKGIISKVEEFLSPSGGSTIPENMEKIELYYTIPIIIKTNGIKVSRGDNNTVYSNLKLIGEGSYATVLAYKDEFYNKKIVVKRAKNNLNAKELERFKKEFEQLKSMNSPYIIEVYRYDCEKNEYLMEYMDYTLFKYITENNTKISRQERFNIIRQILTAFKYVHSKGLLHRDISPTNILVKKYDNIIVVKISDFGLVKIPNSNLTSINTEFKGSFNDPFLLTVGFDKYNILHETFALTRLCYFVLTGKTNLSNIIELNLKKFVEKGLSSDINKRYHSVDEINEVISRLNLN